MCGTRWRRNRAGTTIGSLSVAVFGDFPFKMLPAARSKCIERREPKFAERERDFQETVKSVLIRQGKWPHINHTQRMRMGNNKHRQHRIYLFKCCAACVAVSRPFAELFRLFVNNRFSWFSNRMRITSHFQPSLSSPIFGVVDPTNQVFVVFDSKWILTVFFQFYAKLHKSNQFIVN